MSNITINYAALFGIHSVAAAAIFTVIYAPLAVYYPWKAFTRPNYVFGFLTLFCLIRVVGFAIRAALAGSSTTGSNLGLFIADQILSGMGFSGLLFSMFSLQNDRERVAGIHYKHPIILLLTNRRFYHLMVVAAIALIITGTNMITSTTASSRNTGHTLRTAGTWILFVATVIQGLRSGAFVYISESTKTHKPTEVKNNDSFGDRNAAWLLALVSALLLCRMIYSVIAIRASDQNEATFYPLSALPEFLCACVLGVPGLVLSRAELKERDIELEGYRNRPHVAPTVV